MSRTLSPKLHFLLALALAAAALLGLSTIARADKVGVAAAVNPDAFSVLNGGVRTQVNIGKSIFYNERINTSGAGLVQVLLVDGSTFTVGPGSDLVIDKFVYDPDKNKGEVVATLGKGVVRFVGGKISKQEGGVTVDTPSGSLAIRGGMFQGKVNNQGSLFCFLYGVEMKFTGTGGDVHRVYEPNYTLDLTGGSPTIRPTRPEDTAFFMKALSGGGQVVVPSSSTANQSGNPGNTGDTKSNTLASITSTASQTQTTSQIQSQQNEIDNASSGPSQIQSQPNLTNTTSSTPTSTTSSPPSQTSGTYSGYGAGVFTQTRTPPCTDCSDQPVGGLGNQSPQDVHISFDAAKSTVSASMGLQVLNKDAGNGGGAVINFGGNSSNSTFTDNQNYSAGANASTDPTSITVNNGNGQTNTLVFQNPNDNTASLTGSSSLLCTQCDFLRWGTWTADLNFQDNHSDPTAAPSTNHVLANGFWVAGNIIDDLNLPFSGSATYNGQAEGWVASLLSGKWVTYSATGAMQMVWNFGSRAGTLSISQFDAGNIPGGLSLSGSMCAPGVGCSTPAIKGGNMFSGTLSGQLPTSLVSADVSPTLAGSANGSFVSGPNNLDSLGKPIPQSVPQGVIGNWNVHNPVYGASGIFAGSH